MKNHILNLILIFVIAIGAVLLMQPVSVQAQYQGCSAGPDEDPCEECLGSNCSTGTDSDCGLLQKVGTDEYVMCTKDPGEPM